MQKFNLKKLERQSLKENYESYRNHSNTKPHQAIGPIARVICQSHKGIIIGGFVRSLFNKQPIKDLDIKEGSIKED